MTMPRLLAPLLGCVFASAAIAQVSVPSERIVNSANEPGNWLTHGGNYAGHRYSTLEQITHDNVAKLKPAWVYQARDAGKWEVTPLVVDGIIYLSERPNVVTALDARTGRPVWTYRRPMPENVAGC